LPPIIAIAQHYNGDFVTFGVTAVAILFRTWDFGLAPYRYIAASALGYAAFVHSCQPRLLYFEMDCS
jgi:hypothetical protein